MRGTPPARPYREIARLGAAGRWYAMDRIVENAKRAGADAVIVYPPRHTGTDYSVLDSSSWLTPSMDLALVAIRYR